MQVVQDEARVWAGMLGLALRHTNRWEVMYRGFQDIGKSKATNTPIG
jgi:hypothetical protein